MAKVPYEKPELRRLGLLRELTKMSGWNDGGWMNDGAWHDWSGSHGSGHHRWLWW